MEAVSRTLTALTFATAFLQLVCTVAGHGFILDPVPRQTCNEIRGTIDSGGNGAGALHTFHDFYICTKLTAESKAEALESDRGIAYS